MRRFYQAKLNDVISFEHGDERSRGRSRGQRNFSLLENVREKLLNAANEKVRPIIHLFSDPILSFCVLFDIKEVNTVKSVIISLSITISRLH